MPNPWGTYQKAREERGFLPPLEIDEEKFIFPTSPPARFFTDFLAALDSEEGLTHDKSISLLFKLLPEDMASRLIDKVSSVELIAIISDLLEQYGITGIGEEEQSPNRETRRAKAKASQKGSSSSSARSKQTSGASTS